MLGKIKDKLEIKFWQITKYIIRKGYGADCKTKDTDDFESLMRAGNNRCPSCEAKEIIDWIDNHISLIREFYN